MNVIMPKIVGILTFISKINTSSEFLMQEKMFSVLFYILHVLEQLKFHARLS